MTSDLETAIGLIQSDKLAAKTFFSEFVRDHPEDWRGHFYLAACLANQLAYGDAIRHLERTNDLRPDDPLVCFNLGYCHRQTGNLTLAVFFLAKSTELSGWRDPRCVAVLASTLCELGHTDRALKAISRVDHKSALDPILAAIGQSAMIGARRCQCMVVCLDGGTKITCLVEPQRPSEPIP